MDGYLIKSVKGTYEFQNCAVMHSPDRQSKWDDFWCSEPLPGICQSVAWRSVQMLEDPEDPDIENPDIENPGYSVNTENIDIETDDETAVDALRPLGRCPDGFTDLFPFQADTDYGNCVSILAEAQWESSVRICSNLNSSLLRVETEEFSERIAFILTQRLDRDRYSKPVWKRFLTTVRFPTTVIKFYFFFCPKTNVNIKKTFFILTFRKDADLQILQLWRMALNLGME